MSAGAAPEHTQYARAKLPVGKQPAASPAASDRREVERLQLLLNEVSGQLSTALGTIQATEAQLQASREALARSEAARRRESKALLHSERAAQAAETRSAAAQVAARALAANELASERARREAAEQRVEAEGERRREAERQVGESRAALELSQAETSRLQKALQAVHRAVGMLRESDAAGRSALLDEAAAASAGGSVGGPEDQGLALKIEELRLLVQLAEFQSHVC